MVSVNTQEEEEEEEVVDHEAELAFSYAW